MIFSEQSIQAIIAGTKTQTRRLYKPGQRLEVDCIASRRRVVHRIGQVLSCQPHRNKSAVLVDGKVLRIRITGVREEDVRLISLADVRAEGFESYHAFWRVWCAMHDKTFKGFEPPVSSIVKIHRELLLRPGQYYNAYVLEFERIS